ncbi:histone H1 [Sphingobacterium sp. HMA12]|uniref:histone H1 n=1 Tax=Sphingobacterium sp. HMA12 TaxID=2050894 RepID=UPI000CEA5818|nr:histone H1 [Sphingobacterium sp. HMA12]
MDKFNQLKALIEGAEKDAEAFFNKNNKAAGTRLRNALQETKALSQEIRNDVTAKKNAK